MQLSLSNGYGIGRSEEIWGLGQNRWKGKELVVSRRKKKDGYFKIQADAGNPENMKCLLGTDIVNKEASECKIEMTFMGRGCQKYTKCLAWSKAINVVAFASAGDICFVIPKQNNRCIAIANAVKAHDFPITCLRFVSWYHSNAFGLDYLITGATDGSVRLWAVRLSSKTVTATLISEIGNSAAGRPVNFCAGAVFSKAKQDIIIAIYAISDGSLVAEQVVVDRISLEGIEKRSYEKIRFQPAFIVSGAVHIMSDDDILFILGTTSNNVEIICAKFAFTSLELRKAVTLQGHTDWICSIDIRAYGNDIWVASGGQESIRIWSFNQLQGEKVSADKDAQLKAQFMLFDDENKAVTHTIHITLQGILNAHEDWIYSVEWHSSKLQLLSASNDKTVIIWEPSETDAGLWFDAVRVGDVGGQAVGFFGACFSPDGHTILAYSYFGGFCSWQLEKENSFWKSVSTFGGHSGQVRDIAWDPTGSYLLSCSYDQTTRCYAPSVDLGVISEIARPQVHGYDLTSIASISSSRFVSGADEKILRVFAAPRNFVEMLTIISKYDCQKLFPDPTEIAGQNATIPALGLSNKISDSVNIQGNENLAVGDTTNRDSTFVEGVPVEEYLMQNTLWPEIHKLYGHGFEVFTVTSNHSGTLIASACKSSRVESAVIIIWDNKEWRRRCELQCHKLTVVQLAFSNNDSFLLSVSRDRTFAISVRSSEDPFDWKLLLTSEKKYSKVHSRIIWCCAWAPDDKYFVTGARDKKLCFWHFDGNDIELIAERKHSHPVTAVDFVPKLWNECYILAIGFENGEIEIQKWNMNQADIKNSGSCMKRWLAHSETINRLRFRPKEGSWLSTDDVDNHIWELASASNDRSVIVHQLILI